MLLCTTRVPLYDDAAGSQETVAADQIDLWLIHASPSSRRHGAAGHTIRHAVDCKSSTNGEHHCARHITRVVTNQFKCSPMNFFPSSRMSIQSMPKHLNLPRGGDPRYQPDIRRILQVQSTAAVLFFGEYALQGPGGGGG